MLKRIRGGYELEAGVKLSAEQQERFETIKNYPAGFMPDYEAYVTDGDSPTSVDEEGNKRDLSKHPMQGIVQAMELSQLRGELDLLRGESAGIQILLVTKEVITEDDLKAIREDEQVIKR